MKTNIKRSESLKAIPMEIIIALDHEDIAQGNIIMDDDKKPEPIKNANYRYMKLQFEPKEKKLIVNVTGNYKETIKFEKFSKLSI